jgi:hypothetical protein
MIEANLALLDCATTRNYSARGLGLKLTHNALKQCHDFRHSLA